MKTIKLYNDKKDKLKHKVFKELHSPYNTPDTKPVGERRSGKVADNLKANQICKNTTGKDNIYDNLRNQVEKQHHNHKITERRNK
jgi:hypothetical protein